MEVTPTLKCPNCGAVNRADEFYCSQCRTNLHMKTPVREAAVTASASGAPPSIGSSTTTSHREDSGSGSPVVSRYRDAYRVGSALVGLGTA